MINWIKYDDANNLDYALFEKENKSKYVYFDHRGQITFTPNILTTHFALKSEYLAILPNAQKHDELPESKTVTDNFIEV